MTADQHNKIVDEAWQGVDSESGRLRAAEQILDLYSRANWRRMITRAVYVVCATSVIVTALWRLL